MTDVKSMIKIPLVIAVGVVVVRLLLEQAGAPAAINNVFGVAWLYFIVPFYFAARIARSGDPKPDMTLLQANFVFVLLTRVIVWPTYSLAYAFSWEPVRFSLESGGVVGDSVTVLQGYILIPLRNLAAWTVAGTVIGMVLGSVGLALLRRRAPATSENPSSS